MKTARQILSAPIIVHPHTSVRELAEKLMEARADGACVTEGGKLVGVATQMDLVYKETSLHMPTTFVLLDGVFSLPGARARAERELQKITASKVNQLMTPNPVTVLPDATIQHCANRMFREHLSILPVVDEQGTLIGVVTKDDVVKATGLVDDDPDLKP